MSPLLEALLLAFAAGATIPAGAALARIDAIHPRWLDDELRHSVISFGGGVLLAAVALVLVPEGVERIEGAPALVCFAGGGVAFFLLDRAIERRGGGAANFIAMLLDYVPESIALGAMLAVDPAAGLLLALMIALQNLPEGFNAFREMSAAGARSGPLTAGFLALPLLGPLAAAAGFAFLTEAEAAMGAILLAAAGGILYLTFEDIAPQAYLERRWAPPLGAVAGFGLGLAGHLALHG